MRSPAPLTSRSAALVLLAVALPLSACASGSTSYCEAISSAQAEWAGAGASLRDPAAAVRLVSTVQGIAATAPAEVSADWTSLLTLFRGFTVANPDLSDLTKQMQGFESAAKRIETHAEETCGVDLAR